MPPLAWGGAALAAIAASLAIMLKGGIVKRRPKSPTGSAAFGSSSSSDSGGDTGPDEDPFKRHEGPVRGGPASTQTETGELASPGEWGDEGGGPAVTFSSPGDGGGSSDTAQGYSTGGGAAGSGIPAMGGGRGIGGVVAAPAPVQQAISSQISSGTFGAGSTYVPLGSVSPSYVPGTSSAGGGGSSRL